jgi:CRP/FNR family transcriptional regulator
MLMHSSAPLTVHQVVDQSSVAEAMTLTALLRAQSKVAFNAKRTIFHEEAPADSVLLLESGTVSLFRFLPNGRRLISRFLFAGDIIGLSFDDEYPVSAECVTPVTAYQLSRSVLQRLCAHSPALQNDVVRVLKCELTSEHEDHLPLMHQPSDSRVARLLRMVARRNGAECQKGQPIQLLMTRGDIADYLGLTNETVSRSFKKLKDQGVISESSPNLIRVEDVHRLMSLADGEEAPP